MIYIGFDKDTGRPLGYAAAKSAEKAANNWPGCGVVEYSDEAAPDLDELWVEGGALCLREDVTDQAAKEAMAAEAMEKATAQVTAEAMAKAPNPIYAAKATQASLAIILRTLTKVVNGEALSQAEKDNFNTLANLFTGATSAMGDIDALSYIKSQLDKSDAADAVIKGAAK